MTSLWQTVFGDGPLVACAVHDGHDVRSEVLDCLQLTDNQRLYEEDPYTGLWTHVGTTRIIAKRSRFEFDLNRPREKAVYLEPADAWGLEVWKCRPDPKIVGQSLQHYDDFYTHLHLLLQRLVARHGRVVVLDLHSYNHIREGRGGAPGNPAENPQVNLGTRTMPRELWAPIVDRWLSEMRSFDYFGRPLDVRENVKFFGGHLVKWIHQNFPTTVCALAIEVKKFFMDEWTGELDRTQHNALLAALQRAAKGVLEELEQTKL